MTPRQAKILGAVTGLVLGFTWIGWKMSQGPPCPGVIFLEFRPPLATPGTYHFSLAWSDEGQSRQCNLSVPLPAKGRVDTKGCGARTELRMEGSKGQPRITRFAFGASPAKLRLKIRRDQETVYDLELEPRYAEYPTTREESRSFCGLHALLTPSCVRGSRDCAPYPTHCDGSEDCEDETICCVSPDWAREAGTESATQCLSERRCLDRFAFVACHDEDACPKAHACTLAGFSSDFASPLKICTPRPK